MPRWCGTDIVSGVATLSVRGQAVIAQPVGLGWALKAIEGSGCLPMTWPAKVLNSPENLGDPHCCAQGFAADAMRKQARGMSGGFLASFV